MSSIEISNITDNSIDQVQALESFSSCLPSIFQSQLSQPSQPSQPSLPHHNFTSIDDEPYTIFSKSRIIIIIAVISIAGLLSPLTANVFFPAAPEIKEDLNVTFELINITVTMYLIFQGIAPSFWGTLADIGGRRPIYILSLIVYLGSSTGLALTKNYLQILLLRMIQASGSSSVMAIGAGTVADISISEKRGTYIGYFSVGALAGPVLGTLIAGFITDNFGWRKIFWVLSGICGVVLLLIIIFLPETNRKVVGNGNIKVEPQLLYTSLYDGIIMTQKKPIYSKSHHLSRNWYNGVGHKFLYPILSLGKLNVALPLAYTSIIFSSFYCLNLTLACTLKFNYGFNESQIGLSYLPLGIGAVIGSILGGKVLDYDYRIVAKQTCSKEDKIGKNILSSPPKGIYDPNFVYERARFRSFFFTCIAFPIALLPYGWLLDAQFNIIAPLLLTFIVGFGSATTMNTATTYLIDVSPGRGSSITAANNLTRCLASAISSLWIYPAVNTFGSGPVFTIIGGICFLSTGFILLLLKFGKQSRLKELQKD